MTLLSANDLSKSYGPTDIFSGLTFNIPPGARIAVVGPNGIGKTTLLRILVGLEEPTTGKVSRAKGLSIGYLAQEAGLTGTHTLWEECLNAVAELRVMEAELAQLAEAISSPDIGEEAMERYGKVEQVFERRGGYTYETRIRQVLTGLGFEPSDYSRPLTQLSGGQRTRALLARLLIAGADLLVLDEPTNHLDIAAVEWLEGYLSQWEGAALIVSHDRYFLDKVVDHLWEMSPQRMETYRGNYTAYLKQRQERWERRQMIYESEMERLLKEVDYIKRNISGQNTSQAKGRLRRLSREVEAIQSLGFEAVQGRAWSDVSREAEISEHTLGVEEVERRVRSLRAPSNRPPALHLNLKAHQRSGDLVVRTNDLAIGYPDEGRPLFRAPDLVLKRGECAALIGPNGAGKTTFLKTLLGQMPPLEGDVTLGASLKLGYFAQAHEGLHPGSTLVEEIDSVAPNMLLGAVRDYLARFLFTGEDVFKKVKVLSGGERGRLALAKLALTDANLLLLDEVSNHLDIPSQEVLQDVLADYQGTILLVSHDRYLIDALATQVWEILPDQSALHVFAGTYSQYRAFLDGQKVTALEERTRQTAVQKAAPAARSTGQVRRSKNRLAARLQEVEGLISSLEVQLDTLARSLENPPGDPAKVQRLGEEYMRVQGMINELMSEWESLQVEVHDTM